MVKRFSLIWLFASFLGGIGVSEIYSIFFSPLIKGTPEAEHFNPKRFPPQQAYRSFPRCSYERIPLVSGMLETAEFLLYHPNISFIRFGDADIHLLQGRSLVYQNASSDLVKALYKCFTTDDPSIAIGLPDIFSGYAPVKHDTQLYWDRRDGWRRWILKHVNFERRYFQTWISQMYEATAGTHCLNLPLIYGTLRKIWENKDIILVRGDNKQVYDYDIFDVAKSQKVIFAPRTHAWSAYDELYKQLLAEPADKLYIFTCGHVGKVLTYDMAKLGRRALDLGHLSKDYDAYYGKKSLKDFYKD